MGNSYTPQTWTDGVSSASAARMAVIETGVQGAWATELGYTQFTSNVSVTATTEAAANTVVTASAITFDGSTTALIEFYAARIDPGSTSISVFLFQDGTTLGQIGLTLVAGIPIFVARRLTPASGSRTYSIRAAVNASTGTVYAGAGGAGVNLPGFIRITRT